MNMKYLCKYYFGRCGLFTQTYVLVLSCRDFCCCCCCFCTWCQKTKQSRGLSSFIRIPSPRPDVPAGGQFAAFIWSWTLPEYCEFLCSCSLETSGNSVMISTVVSSYWFDLTWSISFQYFIMLSWHRLYLLFDAKGAHSHHIIHSFVFVFVCLSWKRSVLVWLLGNLGLVCLMGRCPSHQKYWLPQLTEWRRKKNQRHLKTRKTLQGRWDRKRENIPHNECAIFIHNIPSSLV